MKKQLQLFPVLLISFFISQPSLKAQDDCCGMGSILSSVLQSGIYGGYGFQQFSAKGLDLVVDATPSVADYYDDFGFAHGWRVGANVIGVRYNEILFAMKVHYQSVAQTQETTNQENNESVNRELQLSLTSWSLGASLSYIVSNNIDIRIFDLLMTFTNAELTYDVRSASSSVTDVYKSPESQIGFAFDAGVVFYPAPPYLSIEILGGYSIFSIEKVEDENNDVLTTPEDFVDGGGFFAVAVLTIGIPFN